MTVWELNEPFQPHPHHHFTSAPSPSLYTLIRTLVRKFRRAHHSGSRSIRLVGFSNLLNQYQKFCMQNRILKLRRIPNGFHIII